MYREYPLPPKSDAGGYEPHALWFLKRFRKPGEHVHDLYHGLGEVRPKPAQTEDEEVAQLHAEFYQIYNHVLENPHDMPPKAKLDKVASQLYEMDRLNEKQIEDLAALANITNEEMKLLFKGKR